MKKYERLKVRPGGLYWLTIAEAANKDIKIFTESGSLSYTFSEFKSVFCECSHLLMDHTPSSGLCVSIGCSCEWPMVCVKHTLPPLSGDWDF